jgi:hypothetical protein
MALIPTLSCNFGLAPKGAGAKAAFQDRATEFEWPTSRALLK